MKGSILQQWGFILEIFFSGCLNTWIKTCGKTQKRVALPQKKTQNAIILQTLLCSQFLCHTVPVFTFLCLVPCLVWVCIYVCISVCVLTSVSCWSFSFNIVEYWKYTGYTTKHVVFASTSCFISHISIKEMWIHTQAAWYLVLVCVSFWECVPGWSSGGGGLFFFLTHWAVMIR